MIRASALALAVLVLPAATSAQTLFDSQPLAAAPAVGPRRLHVNGVFAAGLEYGAPYKLTGSIRCDLLFDRGGSGNVFLVQPIASAGLGGARVGLGIGVGGTAGFLTARATLGPTFAHPLGAAPDRNWVGGEVEWSFLHLLSLQAGVLRPIGGGHTVFTWSVGIGLPLVSPDGLIPGNP